MLTPYRASLAVTFMLPAACCFFVACVNETRDGQSYFESGLNLYLHNRLPDALAELDHAIEFNSREPAYFHLRGNIHYELHEYERAVEDFSQAVYLKPDDASAFGNRGWSYRRLGKNELAFKDWQKCNIILAARCGPDERANHKADVAQQGKTVLTSPSKNLEGARHAEYK